MIAAEFIESYRTNQTNDLTTLSGYYSFKLELLNGEPVDTNLDFRTEIVEQLLISFSLQDIDLIRSLFAEEVKCSFVIQRHDNLYQLCFYLYELRQIEDCFILYDAKFNTKDMDVGASLDRETMTVGYEVAEVIEYVEKRFAADPSLQKRYPNIIKELQILIDDFDSEDLKAYGKFLKGYFLGHNNVN